MLFSLLHWAIPREKFYPAMVTCRISGTLEIAWSRKSKLMLFFSSKSPNARLMACVPNAPQHVGEIVHRQMRRRMQYR